MTERLSEPCTAFDGGTLLSSGPLIEVALSVRQAIEAGSAGSILVFSDTTGRVVDLDLRGSKAELIARLSQPLPDPDERSRSRRPASSHEAGTGADEPRGRGRPRLGVIGREVTLLPRHWEWLATQPGGASVALRKLVDEARRSHGAGQKTRLAQEAAYRFMSAMAGDLPGFEEAARALFANDRARFEEQVSNWPDHIRAYATRLAFVPAADGAASA